MKIIVTGSSGLIGSALVRSFIADGHEVVRLVRHQQPATISTTNNVKTVVWHPEAGGLAASELEGCEAAVHLAGENVAEGKWTNEKKRRIRDSRVLSTQLLVETLAQLAVPPKVLVCASAIGYYGGDRGSEVLGEESQPGTDFLARVCQEWEAAAEPAARSSVRVVNTRIGVVLSSEGGALAKMLTPFRMGVGGKVGSGKQYMSWIALDDVVAVIRYALANESLSGPVNAVAPHPVTNEEFTQTLGRVLGRPTLFSVPAFAARLAFGEMADALLLASSRVEPARLLAADYRFAHPQLEEALTYLLRK